MQDRVEYHLRKGCIQALHSESGQRRDPCGTPNLRFLSLRYIVSNLDIKNYRPISLLPIMYKVFSNILLQRMIRMLDFHQPREQAGFRAGYSTIDHLQVVNQLQEKANEYNMPLCFAFVDYEKAFRQHRI